MGKNKVSKASENKIYIDVNDEEHLNVDNTGNQNLLKKDKKQKKKQKECFNKMTKEIEDTKIKIKKPKKKSKDDQNISYEFDSNIENVINKSKSYKHKIRNLKLSANLFEEKIVEENKFETNSEKELDAASYTHKCKKIKLSSNFPETKIKEEDSEKSELIVKKEKKKKIVSEQNHEDFYKVKKKKKKDKKERELNNSSTLEENKADLGNFKEQSSSILNTEIQLEQCSSAVLNNKLNIDTKDVSNLSKNNKESYPDNTKFSQDDVNKSQFKNQYYRQEFWSDVPLAKKRNYTVSIAFPASILQYTCIKQIMKTYIIGQLSRAACIYSIDEIIVYNDNCWKDTSYDRGELTCIEDAIEMLKMILEYQECPQYLRKNFFPFHHYITYAGVLSALNAPHHLLARQWCTYREGVVTEKYGGKFSYVNLGFDEEVEIDLKLEPGRRVTVKFPPEAKSMRKKYAKVVSPDEPREVGGLYWGYTVRSAQSFSQVFEPDRFEKYDLVIGTSDKGKDFADVEFPTFKHALIVFGGVDGLEVAMERDEKLQEKDPQNFFKYYVNTCPHQTSRTIRTEEAVLISLASLSGILRSKGFVS